MMTFSGKNIVLAAVASGALFASMAGWAATQVQVAWASYASEQGAAQCAKFNASSCCACCADSPTVNPSDHAPCSNGCAKTKLINCGY